MAIFGTPFIPYTITVHLGRPEEAAANVTVPFPDYIKNVASSEIYPTWEDAALRANIIAQISFALNRVFTEYYRSRGFNFTITSSTTIDQAFIKNRNIFQNISVLVDEIFTHYIRRQGFIEPLLAQFCNGTTSLCAGLSQWGSQSLAVSGYDYWSILEYYYGTNIELITDAPIRPIVESYPRPSLKTGSIGEQVYFLQIMLNRVSRAYPAIPKVFPETGVFDRLTDEAVRTFQSVFKLTVDGIVGAATWYKFIYLYTGLLRLSELASEGHTIIDSPFTRPDYLTIGDQGESVLALQYLINVFAAFYDEVTPVTADGKFGEATRQSVLQIQRQFGRVQNGIVDPVLWALMLDQYEGIRETVFDDPNLFPLEAIARSSLSPSEVNALFASLRV